MKHTHSFSEDYDITATKYARNGLHLDWSRMLQDKKFTLGKESEFLVYKFAVQWNPSLKTPLEMEDITLCPKTVLSLST